MRLFIDDGCTLNGKIAARGALGALEYTYRPAMAPAIADYRHAVNYGGSGAVKLAAENKLLADHLVSWNATKGGGAAPLTADSFNRIPDSYRGEMIAEIILGFERQEAAEKN